MLNDTHNAQTVETSAEVTTDFLKSKTGSFADLDRGEDTTTVAEVETQEATDDSQLSLEEQLALHDSLADSETEAVTAEDTSEDAQPDWTSEKMQQLSKDFKEVMGVDIKEGFDLIAELRTELASIKESKQQDTLQSAATKLQEAWGVNDAEVQRRAAEVAAYAAKLPESLRQAVDNVDGIQLAWQHIQSSKANKQSKGKGSVEPDGNTRTYSRKQVSEWMRNDEATYDLHAAAIAAARKAGRMTD